MSSAHKQSELAGPKREVVYIFEREGERGGGLWLLVLDCGHAVTRKHCMRTTESLVVSVLLRPLSEKLAPKRAQCHYCGSGSEKQDPWIMIKALGGDVS